MIYMNNIHVASKRFKAIFMLLTPIDKPYMLFQHSSFSKSG